MMFSFFKKKPVDLFSEAEKKQITDAIKQAELATSGEIRIYIENKCGEKDALKKAEALFNELKMYATKERNGVLIYLAMVDKKLAIFGDAGIHEKVGDAYWNNTVSTIISHFNAKNYVGGIVTTITEIGNALQLHFPYDKATDTNELSDEIVFG